MKLPNGYGSVIKLKGTRRKPYMVKLTQGYKIQNGKSIQNRVILGYYPTKKEAIEALAEYNKNPYDINTKEITFAEVYRRWSEDHSKTLKNNSSMRSYKAAFNHSVPLHKMAFKDIRPNHMEKTIENANVGSSSKSRMKSMYNLMYRYAMKYDIVEKDYASLCFSVKVDKAKEKIPFSFEEVQRLWNCVDEIQFCDMVLIEIYTGFRPIEIATIRTENVYLDEDYIIGGTKTEAGTNRQVPIHPDIKDLIISRYDPSQEFLFEDYNMFEHKKVPLTYDKYRNRFRKVMDTLDMKHTPHETRHTFITRAKDCNINEYALKKIVGHEVRDVTEKIYTHRTVDTLFNEIKKIKFK